ncbi:hypothetical protein CRI77_15975 [Mycolicibacterium duvalii]|uniref:Uncharacterized protein n=1 Tax=Mycolicibacterium duvalii TaxID=39688 RepID=A0A7I7K4Z5_9MYCO|nr:DUF4344 domain-containing metallopeptidase [Mycolicibacterium duvalii]MCV7367772.1 DUF4344 domain-containing metallopeptidase [Mycolicibacterium duvalii]PEG39408.1 hypothetical protein CRI77_15975 [Mycolicibacterium duvalii]BBX18638.1 hypothetical protein MDUV_34980 [Mycolicibacterium duvalii]
MRGAIVSGLAIALLVVGCAGQQETSTESAESPTAAAQAQGPEAATDDGDGTMVVTYQDASSPEAVNGRALLQDNTVLEDLAADINESLILPYDIALIGAECGEANAYWDPAEDSITICYEDADGALATFTADGVPDPTAAMLNSEIATFYHEVGHMAISIYDLPITGREEDVADQLAAYVLLQPGDDGRPDPEAVQAVKDFARTFQEGDSGELGAEDFADTHSFGETRAYNLQCWIYGADPDANADLVGDGGLPQDRADGCEDEYTQLDNAWSTLLEPHLK